MAEPLVEPHVLEYPGGYTRSVGPVIGRFLTGLRDGRIEAVRLADGRVLVPPTEYDPSTSAPVARRRSRTGSRSARAAPCRRSRGSREPRAGQAPAHEAVRVRADPARRRRHRAAAHGRLRQRRRDPRSARASRRAGGPSAPVTSPTSRRGSRSATARSPSRRRCTCPPRTSSPSPASPSPIRLEYELTAGASTARYLEGSRRGQDHRRPRAVERRRVRRVTRHRPDHRRARRRSRSRCRTPA